MLQIETIKKLLQGRIAKHHASGELPAAVGELLRVREPWRRNVDGTFRYVADYDSSAEIRGGLAQHQILWQSPVVMPFDAIRLTVTVRGARRLRDRGWLMTLEPIPADEVSTNVRTGTFHEN
ncbi:MAG: hypothetical protein ABI640_13135 [Gammaproteobacteria bacterium]